MERRRSGHQSSRGSLREIVEEPRESPLPAEEQAVYVAVEKEIREWRENFLWVLKNTSKEKKIVIVHVHRPAHRIPTGMQFLPLRFQFQEPIFPLCFPVNLPNFFLD